ncbi:family 43 glycosylhydrolase [Pedobacter panaciterrae]
MKIISTGRLRIANNLFTYAIIIASIFSGCAKKDPESVSKATLKSNEATQKLLSVDLMSGNPILPVATADPDIIYANGKYYIYPTATGPNASQFHAYSSTDLLNWTDEGIVLDLVNVSWAHTDGWAPSVVARNGNYYFYYTAAKKSVWL